MKPILELSKQLWQCKLWQDWFKERGWREGDWCIPLDIDVDEPYLIHFATRQFFIDFSKDGKEIIINAIPLPSWADCREFLREQGVLISLDDGIISTEKIRRKHIVEIFFKEGGGRYLDSIGRTFSAPTEEEALIQICLEVCNAR